jgi:hypothetical protein
VPTYPTRTYTLDDKIVSTLETYISTKAADQIFDHNLILGWLWKSSKEPGVVGPVPSSLGLRPNLTMRQSGRLAVLPVAFNSSSTVETFRGTQVLQTAIDPIMTEAASPWAYYTGYVGQALTEKLENSGREALLSILQERIDMLFRTFSYRLETDFWSTNTDVVEGTQDEIPGIQHMISTSPSSSVNQWQLNRSTYTWWRNTADTVGSFATNGLDKMSTMFRTISGTSAMDPPTCMITTPTVFNYYIKQAQGIHRIVGDSKTFADLGFPAVEYEGRPIFHTSLCPSGYMYFPNLNYWKLLLKEGAVWETVDPDIPNNQLLSFQRRVIWGGTWGITQPRRQGVLSSITA